VLVGSDSVLARSDGEVVDLLRGGQGVLNIVPLAGVVGELEAAIVEIARGDKHVKAKTSRLVTTKQVESG